MAWTLQGLNLDRSTFADWLWPRCLPSTCGRFTIGSSPTSNRLRLFADEKTTPLLDSGRNRTRTGQLWTYAWDSAFASLLIRWLAYVTRPPVRQSVRGPSCVLIVLLQVDGHTDIGTACSTDERMSLVNQTKTMD